MQQVGVLADHADGVGEVGEADVAQVDAVEQHPAGGRVVQPRDQAGESGLAAAGLADEGEAGAGGYVQVDAVQDVGSGVVGERDVARG